MNEMADLIKGYYVYEYEHVDDLSFISTPETFFESRLFEKFSLEEMQEIVDSVAQRFLESGWEGDGEIGVIWLPPFVDAGIEDTWGTYLWHVKQRNNGTSFVLSERPLAFRRILAQNEKLPDGVPVSIVELEVDGLVRSVTEIEEDIQAKLACVELIPECKLASVVVDDLLAHNQGIVVRRLHQFLDICYLRLLVEVVNNGNRSGIKIRKSRVHLNLQRYMPEEIGDDDDAGQWFTLQGIVSDMWAAYKFEPYRQKIEMLFTAVGFKCDLRLRDVINKHVAIRNCIQHHDGGLDRGALQECGLSKFTIKSASGSIELKAGDVIRLTHDEISELTAALKRIASEFGVHVSSHIRTRYYVRKPRTDRTSAPSEAPTPLKT